MTTIKCVTCPRGTSDARVEQEDYVYVCVCAMWEITNLCHRNVISLTIITHVSSSSF